MHFHRNGFRTHSFPNLRSKNQELRFAQESLGNLRFKTKNQEPRFAQESLGNLGSWFLVLVWKFQVFPECVARVPVSLWGSGG